MEITPNDSVSERILHFKNRVDSMWERDHYHFNQPVTELSNGLTGGMEVVTKGRKMQMFATYSYLGLIGHPKINAAAHAAIDKYGTGTHGVRFLAGTLDIHDELEATIADFKEAEGAITFSSGYAANLAGVSTLVGRGDVVIVDKYDHASIIDGCFLSGAKMKRFRHNDMDHLETQLKNSQDANGRLVVVDSVFSMDGDIINLPAVVELCRKYNAWLMVDEAHSIGVLGETGRGIEEHFGLDKDAIDIKMGTMSKTIPSVGGYIAGRKELINLLRNNGRSYLFSAAIPPAQTAAANMAFKIILEEPWRVKQVQANAKAFISGLKNLGFNTLLTETAIVPLICGPDDTAYEMVRLCQADDLFALPVVSPAVPPGLARVRAVVTATHTADQIEQAISVFEKAGKEIGLI